MTQRRNAAVFLDRDGVLNRSIDRGGVPSPPRTVEEFELLPGVHGAVQQLRSSGFKLVVVTNQPDIARGVSTVAAVDAINDELRRALAIDDVLVCPHDDGDDCPCRKPKPGMLLEATERYDVDLARSFMVGDRWRDVAAGKAAGCRTVQVGSLDEGVEALEPTIRCADLAGATSWILAQEVGRAGR